MTGWERQKDLAHHGIFPLVAGKAIQPNPTLAEARHLCASNEPLEHWSIGRVASILQSRPV